MTLRRNDTSQVYRQTKTTFPRSLDLHAPSSAKTFSESLSLKMLIWVAWVSWQIKLAGRKLNDRTLFWIHHFAVTLVQRVHTVSCKVPSPSSPRQCGSFTCE